MKTELERVWGKSYRVAIFGTDCLRLVFMGVKLGISHRVKTQAEGVQK